MIGSVPRQAGRLPDRSGKGKRRGRSGARSASAERQARWIGRERDTVIDLRQRQAQLQGGQIHDRVEALEVRPLPRSGRRRATRR